MLINIYIDKKELKNGLLNSVLCPNCKEVSDMHYKVFGGFSRVVIVPFMPAPKVIILECDQCKKTHNLNQLPSEIKDKLKKEVNKDPIKTPIWQYSGLIISGILLSFAIYTGISETDKDKLYSQYPKIGDIYRIKNEKYFTTLKVNSVMKDSVAVFVNDLQTDRYNGIDEINVPQNYNTIIVYPRQFIRTMYNENKIYQIDRDE